jgi:hypothetical protein
MAAGLALWVSDTEGVPPTAERLREHDRVVRAALRSATPLPVRFGAPLRDTAAARALLAEREDAFRTALERLAATVEMGVSLRWDAGGEASEAEAAPPPAAGADPLSGRAYLERLRRAAQGEARLRERARARLHALEALIRDARLETVEQLLPVPDVAGTLAHLVRREAIGDYRDRVARACERFPDERITLSGPWAPYSFV